MPTFTALDLFAGTGWGVACRRLGIEEAGVEMMPEAVATRAANGMRTLYNDVWDGLLRPEQIPALVQYLQRGGTLEDAYELLIASPPCQTFSMAGKGAGRAALDEVLEAISLHAYKDPAQLLEFGERHDLRTALVLAPLAHVWRDRPEYVVFEQVPTVLPVWEACAAEMADWGYDVKTAVLNAEQYGVPQTRKRAFLVARLGGEVRLPVPTHSRYYSSNPSKLDEGVLPWVSMAEALGWSEPHEFPYFRANRLKHSAIRDVTSPAPTITAGHSTSDRGFQYELDSDCRVPGEGRLLTVEEAAALQTYPAGRGLADRPSPTITGGGTEAGGAEPIAKFHERYTSAPGWVGSTDRLSPAECATLQTYPPEPAFVWPCSKTKAFLQIGNAVPPLLGEVILSALLGLDG